MILVPLCSDKSIRGSFYLVAQEVRVTRHARPRAFFSLKASIKNRRSHFHLPTGLFLDQFIPIEHIKINSGSLSLFITEILRVTGSPVRTMSQRILAYFDGFTLIISTRIDQFWKSWSRFEGFIDIFNIEPFQKLRMPHESRNQALYAKIMKNSLWLLLMIVFIPALILWIQTSNITINLRAIYNRISITS